MKLKFTVLVAVMVFACTTIFAQSKAPENWFNLDASKDKVAGVSTEEMYATILKNRKSKTVVVAVIDSGIDTKHEDLKDIIWVNEDEIPGNGIDDDKNGYIDDVNGWNFIGGKDGSHVNAETLEMTRLFVKYKKQFGDRTDAAGLSKTDAADFKEFQRVKKVYLEKLESAKQGFGRVSGIYTQYQASSDALKAHLKTEKLTKEAIEGVKSTDEKVVAAKAFFMDFFARGVELGQLASLKGAYDYYNDQVNYNLNAEFDPRSIIGDNYADPYERYYGNNDVKGPDASHGTHVAGIIGAVRGNGVGMDGVADNVRIMVIRCVPNGDERDKDVANAIRYAAENGASVINMSFGKSFSWNKKVVDDAVKYAASKDVLLVHAAGNDSKNNDETDNFPRANWEGKKKKAKNWIEVGALSWKDNQVAGFTNYGKKNVDVVAPGVDIYSTTPEQEYDSYSGTSMASPVVAGVAAVIRSYFPDLNAKQVKKIIEKTVVTDSDQYNVPGTKDEKTSLSELCKTGGMVNAKKAVEAAAKKSKGLGKKSGPGA